MSLVDAYQKYFAYQFKRRRLARPGSVDEWRAGRTKHL